jgi:hypothetical protein
LNTAFDVNGAGAVLLGPASSLREAPKHYVKRSGSALEGVQCVPPNVSM